MKKFARCFAVVVACVCVVGLTAREAHAACPTSENTNVQNLRSALATKYAQGKFAEADAIYQALVKIDQACATPQDHTYGGLAARRRGDIHNALLRFTTGGNTAAIADVNRTYGMVRINASSNAPTPRVLAWWGGLVTDSESIAVITRVRDLVPGPNRVVGYLLPGRYFIRSDLRVVVEFEVKAGETVIVNYP